MASRRIVVTGAASGLGRGLVAVLAREPALAVTAIVRGDPPPPVAGAAVDCVVQDLREPLSDDATARLAAADCIVHLAWARPAGPVTPAAAAADNAAMLERMLAVPDAGRRMLLMSSVAASPRAPGHYGRAKHAAQMRIVALGGRAVVCGLAVGDPPKGAFKLLVDAHRRLPVAVRLVPNRPRVYPVLEDDVVRLLAALACADSPAGAYRGFAAGGVPINDFIGWLLDRERLHRLRVPTPAIAIDAATAMARLAGRDSLAEKLATFFFKDPAALEGLLDPPETTLSASERQFSQLAGVRG